MNYADTLDKALSYLRELEIDKAAQLLFKLLLKYPTDLQIIDQIYVFAVKKPQSNHFKKICLHLFNLNSQKSEFRQRLLKAYVDYHPHFPQEFAFDKEIRFNLFLHLTQSYLHLDSDKLRQLLKREYPDDDALPDLLKHDCEQLIAQSKLLKACAELKYLIAYYAETNAGQWAINQQKQIESQIIL